MAEARTEAGLTGAVGDIRTAAVPIAGAADRVTPAAARILVQDDRAAEAGTFLEAEAGVAVGLAADDRRRSVSDVERIFRRRLRRGELRPFRQRLWRRFHGLRSICEWK